MNLFNSLEDLFSDEFAADLSMQANVRAEAEKKKVESAWNKFHEGLISYDVLKKNLGMHLIEGEVK